jgi:hypothetical protein
LLLQSVGCSAGEPIEGLQEDDLAVFNSVDTASGSGDLINAANLVEGSLPPWDSTIMDAEASLVTNTFVEASATDLASFISSGEFIFQETRKNGKRVYASADGQQVLKSRDFDGYWKLIVNKSPASSLDGAMLSKQEATDLAIGTIKQFGVPGNEMYNSRAHYVMASNPNDPSLSGTRLITVFTDRKVAGVRVHGSRSLITYDMVGNLYQLEVRWPEFSIDETDTGSLKTREEAITDIAAQLLIMEEQMDRGRSDIKMELVYVQHPSTGVHFPAIRCYITDDFHSPDHMIITKTYSLIDGFIEVP